MSYFQILLNHLFQSCLPSRHILPDTFMSMFLFHSCSHHSSLVLRHFWPDSALVLFKFHLHDVTRLTCLKHHLWQSHKLKNPVSHFLNDQVQFPHHGIPMQPTLPFPPLQCSSAWICTLKWPPSSKSSTHSHLWICSQPLPLLEILLFLLNAIQPLTFTTKLT